MPSQGRDRHQIARHQHLRRLVRVVLGDDGLEALRAARPAEPPVSFDPAEFFAGVKTISGAGLAGPLLTPTNSRLGRQVLRKLGISRIEVQRDADGGWTFTAMADLAHLVMNGASAPSDASPSTSCAGVAGARTAVTPRRSRIGESYGSVRSPIARAGGSGASGRTRPAIAAASTSQGTTAPRRRATRIAARASPQ